MKENLEIEVKLACADLGRLTRAGFELQLGKPRHFEDNWLLDDANRALFKQGAALRIRAVEGRGWATYKGVAQEPPRSPLKIREEIESAVSDPEKLIALFERLGYHRAFRYQKYRTTYTILFDGAALEVAFDETPMGNFIEIEGDEGRVLGILERAGFTAADSIRESYPELQAIRCQARGVPLEDLIFE
ncbi:MAG: adenylate cyclase, class 2 [Blastocatellia bacterium]